MPNRKPLSNKDSNPYTSITDAILNGRVLAALSLLVICLAVPTIQFGDDGPRWFIWTIGLLSIALPTLPLSLAIFKRHKAVSGPFSLAIGLLLISYTSWTSAYLHILPFRRWSIVLIYLVLLLIVWGRRSNREAVREAILERDFLTPALLFASLFVLTLAAWTYVRGLMPKAEGLEKFMDYGFMMSMWRSDYLPAKDIWLAGQPINYYYYGQFVYTMLSKFMNIMPMYSYNLGMASTMAYVVVLAAALGWLLFKMAIGQYRERFTTLWQTLAAGFAAFFVAIAGNSHAFFYADNAPGQGLLRWLSDRGIEVGSLASFYFADSTRYIGYNPDTADKTIHEFPYYSFLVADLHAHVANTVFVLLLLGILLAYYDRKQLLILPVDHDSAVMDPKSFLRQSLAIWRRLLTEPTILIAGLLLAVFMMCNFWDFAIYLVVIAFVFVSRNLRDEEQAGGPVGLAELLIVLFALFFPFLAVDNPLVALLGYALAVLIAFLLMRFRRNAFSRGGLQLASLFFLAHFFAYPFNRQFEAISKSIRLTTNQSTPQQLMILWGGHILLVLLTCIFLILVKNRQKRETIEQGFLERMDGSWVVILLAISGIGLVIAPEILYVRDIYEANYARANTMFKFTYQAFILMSLVLAVLLPLLLAYGYKAVHKKFKWSNALVYGVSVLATLSLYIMPAYYPFVATSGWVPNPKTSEWQGLDAQAWMNSAYAISGSVNHETRTYDLSVDSAAIKWLNEHVSGQPTILEAAGHSYTHLNRISAYTGLPTVMGWETHEWLWRTSKTNANAYSDVVWPKQTDVETVYNWSDPERALGVLRDLEVEYIIIGELELLRYPDMDLDQLLSLGETVFHQGLMRIVQINPYTLG